MNNAPIYRIVFIAVLGGFLFGLNMAGISGAVNSIKELFSLTDNGIGLMVSALTAGCLVGALFTGGFADRFGRRRMFLAVALLFVISSAGCALSYNPPMLTLFRFLSGLAVGADSVIGPMYISEIAPAGKRGRLVSFQQFAITIGILAAYLFDYLLLGRPTTGGGCWRFRHCSERCFSSLRSFHCPKVRDGSGGPYGTMPEKSPSGSCSAAGRAGWLRWERCWPPSSRSRASMP